MNDCNYFEACRQTKSDPEMFTMVHGAVIVMLFVYANNDCVVANCNEVFTYVIDNFEKRFEVRRLGEVKLHNAPAIVKLLWHSMMETCELVSILLQMG